MDDGSDDEEHEVGGNVGVEPEAGGVEGSGDHDPEGGAWGQIVDAEDYEDGEGSAAPQYEMGEDDGEEEVVSPPAKRQRLR